MRRETTTDITTDDKVYLQIGHEEGVGLELEEAMVLARELIGHALAIGAPEFDAEIDIRLKLEV